MARITPRKEIKELNPEAEELLKNTPEAGMLGGILDLIKSQQQELKDYMDRKEQVARDLEGLELRKKDSLAEVIKIEQANEELKNKLKKDLQPLVNEIESKKEELINLELNLKTEKTTTESKINELHDKIKQEDQLYLEVVELNKNNLKLIEDDRIKRENENKLLNDDKGVLLEEIHKLNSDLSNLDIKKDNLSKDIIKLEGKVSEFNNNISELSSNIDNLNKDKEKIINSNQQLVEETFIKLKNLEKESENQLDLVNKEKVNKLKDLEQTKNELDDFKFKLESIKEEYQKILNTIAVFISKKNEVDRREESLKRKYQEAGFSW